MVTISFSGETVEAAQAAFDAAVVKAAPKVFITDDSPTDPKPGDIWVYPGAQSISIYGGDIGAGGIQGWHSLFTS